MVSGGRHRTERTETAISNSRLARSRISGNEGLLWSADLGQAVCRAEPAFWDRSHPIGPPRSPPRRLPSMAQTAGYPMSKLEDAEEIRQLYARYCHAGDSGDCDAFAQCFTEDAVTDANGDVFKGREAIRKTCEAYRPVYATTPMRHVIANILISVEGDEAEATSYYLLLRADNEPGLLRTGTYRDRLRRVDGSWYLSEHVARSDGGRLTAPSTDE